MRRFLTAAAFTVTAVASFAGGEAAARPLYQPVTFNIPGSLPGAVEGKSYSYGLARFASGGTGPPYDFNVKGGLPPAGIHLNAVSGLLSGAASGKTGDYTFTVCATGRRRPVGGSAPGNTACASTTLAVGRGSEPPPPPQLNCGFNLAAVPPGVNVDIDGARQTVVVSVAFNDPRCNEKVTFSTVGSPPTGLSISFLSPPAGTQGTTLSLAAAQDATGGNYNLVILGTSSRGDTAQTTVVVTINEPDFSGTYTGTYRGTITYTDVGCTASEGGTATVQVVKQLPAGYAVTITLLNAPTALDGQCNVTARQDRVFNEAGTYSNGTVSGTDFSITSNSASGQLAVGWTRGNETVSWQAQR